MGFVEIEFCGPLFKRERVTIKTISRKQCDKIGAMKGVNELMKSVMC